MRRLLTVIGLSAVASARLWAAEPAASSSTVIISSDAIPTVSVSTAPILESTAPVADSAAVHAIHLTASAAGSKRYRLKLERMMENGSLNALVVDLKDEGGEVYVPGIKAVERAGSYRREIPDMAAWVAQMKARHVYMIGRVVVFKDNIMPRKSPSMGVHNQNGDLWFDRKRVTWLDPYNRDAWRYIHLIALRAAELGFDEIQFDYIRFPTDGPLSQMRFARPYSKSAASRDLVEFLAQARQLLHPVGAKISIDVFGLTTSVNSGMGIGQVLGPMAAEVDFVCPMTYPSHYNKGEYGLANPNDQPYKTISYAMRDAIRTLGPAGRHKLRPYLQDFSLKGRGMPYRAKEVRAQIQAAADMGIMSWTLWNANCHYTLEAIRNPILPAVSSSTEKTAK